ncbi:unnamed protein product [Didymodactylos carnosus]|uniref:Uncharacterized protein n=2 Tax=Didymodactylos carnosus TaxID=1234261 RepID=A0A814AVQ9_9BILA|nr:unnamed protein product [Didymodactylos carnosus]CAF3699202.1 unnamed protein product [Didymodactylos carnosus]
MAGVMKAKDVAPNYFKDIITLFFGTMTLAYAVEKVNLHRRIALFVLQLVGSSAKWTMAGIMGVTAFLSMWINNSAATSIMLPVAIAITDEFEKHHKEYKERKHSINQSTTAVNNVSNLTTADVPEEHSMKEVVLDAAKLTTKLHTGKYEKLKKGFLLSIAYSSSIGGLSTLVGTTPNIFMKGFVDERYSGTKFKVTFQNFLFFALPTGILIFFQCRSDEETLDGENNLRNMLRKQYSELKTPNWSEYTMGIVFILLILLWITRDFSSTPGWDVIFRPKYISDGTVALFVGILPLILPNQNPFKSLAVAEAFQASKLSESVAEALSFISGAPRNVIILTIIIISGLFTEVTSNLSTAYFSQCWIRWYARTSNIHVAYLILPCTLAVSLAFMLPIATPPNAIVFASGKIRVWDMIKTGIVMNIIGFLVIFLAAITWMPKIYNLNDELLATFHNMSDTTPAT